jgi:hypothetical protein
MVGDTLANRQHTGHRESAKSLGGAAVGFSATLRRFCCGTRGPDKHQGYAVAHWFPSDRALPSGGSEIFGTTGMFALVFKRATRC